MLIVAAAVGAWGQQTDTYITVTFSPEGYATYYDSSHDVVLPDNMKAWVVNGVNADGGTFVMYKQIAGEGTDTKRVPAGTAVLLQADPSIGDGKIEIGLAEATEDTYGDQNLLRGFDDYHLTEGGDVYYKLSYGDGTMSGTFGWFWGEENGDAFESQPHKAYLALTADCFARFLALPGFDEASGIAAATLGGGFAANNAAWFTLDGRRLNAQPANAGIYIRGGKKVAIK